MATNKTKNIPADYYVDENQQRTKSNTPEVIEETTVVDNAETSNRDYQGAGDVTVTDTTVAKSPGKEVEVKTEETIPTGTESAGTENPEETTDIQTLLNNANDLVAKSQQRIEETGKAYTDKSDAYRQGVADAYQDRVSSAESLGRMQANEAQDQVDIIQQDIDAKTKENEMLSEEGKTDYRNARRAALYTSLAEFGANLANLWGTTKGATSAKIERPRDWMARAEEIRDRERTKRDARNKETRDLIRQRMAAERAKQRIEEKASVDVANARTEARLATLQNELQLAMTDYEKAVAEGKNAQDYAVKMQTAYNNLLKELNSASYNATRAEAALINANANQTRAQNAGNAGNGGKGGVIKTNPMTGNKVRIPSRSDFQESNIIDEIEEE